jgi:hypothetical protein
MNLYLLSHLCLCFLVLEETWDTSGKQQIFEDWDRLGCNAMQFGGTHRPHLQGEIIREARNMLSLPPASANLLLRLLFDPKGKKGIVVCPFA